MERFVAYFDILGFAKFIENNDKVYVDKMMNNLFRDSQMAITKGLPLLLGNGAVATPDLSQANVNCLHISDSIIFWSVDSSEESFRTILAVCHTFLNQTLQTSFPMRGCLTSGDIEFDPFYNRAVNGTVFFNSSLYGTGLLSAYYKAEAQQWVGCYLDETIQKQVDMAVINELVAKGLIINHQVPVKDGKFIDALVVAIAPAGINDTLYENLVKRVQTAFTRHGKGNPIDPIVQPKIDNTIDFLQLFREKSQAGA